MKHRLFATVISAGDADLVTRSNRFPTRNLPENFSGVSFESGNKMAADNDDSIVRCEQLDRILNRLVPEDIAASRVDGVEPFGVGGGDDQNGFGNGCSSGIAAGI